MLLAARGARVFASDLRADGKAAAAADALADAGVEIELERVERAFLALGALADCVVVEGAGHGTGVDPAGPRCGHDCASSPIRGRVARRRVSVPRASRISSWLWSST